MGRYKWTIILVLSLVLMSSLVLWGQRGMVEEYDVNYGLVRVTKTFCGVPYSVRRHDTQLSLWAQASLPGKDHSFVLLCGYHKPWFGDILTFDEFFLPQKRALEMLRTTFHETPDLFPALAEAYLQTDMNDRESVRGLIEIINAVNRSSVATPLGSENNGEP